MGNGEGSVHGRGTGGTDFINRACGICVWMSLQRPELSRRGGGVDWGDGDGMTDGQRKTLPLVL